MSSMEEYVTKKSNFTVTMFCREYHTGLSNRFLGVANRNNYDTAS